MVSNDNRNKWIIGILIFFIIISIFFLGCANVRVDSSKEAQDGIPKTDKIMVDLQNCAINGVCEPAFGETAENCPQDCVEGENSGSPDQQYELFIIDFDCYDGLNYRGYPLSVDEVIAANNVNLCKKDSELIDFSIKTCSNRCNEENECGVASYTITNCYSFLGLL